MAIHRTACPHCDHPHNFRTSSALTFHTCQNCGAKYALPEITLPRPTQAADVGGCLMVGCVVLGGLFIVSVAVLIFVGGKVPPTSASTRARVTITTRRNVTTQNRPIDREGQAELLLDRANRALLQGRRPDAAKMLEELVAKYPETEAGQRGRQKLEELTAKKK